MNSTYGLTKKNQVTVPKSVREKLDLRERGRLKFKEENGKVYVEKVPTMEEVAQELQADLKRRGVGPATDKEIKNARYEFHRKGMSWD